MNDRCVIFRPYRHQKVSSWMKFKFSQMRRKIKKPIILILKFSLLNFYFKKRLPYVMTVVLMTQCESHCGCCVLIYNLANFPYFVGSQLNYIFSPITVIVKWLFNYFYRRENSVSENTCLMRPRIRCVTIQLACNLSGYPFWSSFKFKSIFYPPARCTDTN